MTRHFRYRSSPARLVQLIAICGITSQAFGAASIPWPIDIRRMPETNGDVAYEADFIRLPGQVVHLPNGAAVSTTIGADVTFNSLEALKTAFVGEWTNQ